MDAKLSNGRKTELQNASFEKINLYIRVAPSRYGVPNTLPVAADRKSASEITFSEGIGCGRE